VLQDRRRHTRQLITPHLYVALNSSTSGGVLTDVSEGGMALNLLGPPVSDDVLLDLNLPESSEHFQTKGQIAWTKNSERRVGLKFVDLTESSLLQIKKWLAISPVTTELKQNLQSVRTEQGTNVRDTEAAEAAGSGAIVLNHKKLETTGQPTELGSINITGTKHIRPRDAKAKAIANAIPTIDMHTAREEPVTKAPETRTPELPASPGVTSDSGAGLLPEIKESSAKKRFSAWANDGVRVKVKTLEALLTEKPRVHADIPKPTRRERKEPVTQAQETQLAEAPGSASVGIFPSDRLLQSSVPVDFEPNAPTRQLEKIAEPSALGTIGVTKTKSAAADVREPNEALFAAVSPGLRTEKKAPTIIEDAVQTPEFPASLTPASGQDDNLAQTLRTSFARSEARQVRAPLLERSTEEVALDRGVLRRWILASVVIFLLIVLLAAARWIYTSPIFNKIASAADLREMIAGASRSESGPKTKAVAPDVDSKGAERQSRQEKGKAENAEMRRDGTNVRGPRVRLDAQNRRSALSQVSTSVKAPSPLRGTNHISEAQPTGLPTQEQVGARPY
jgi:hypothetical protein